MNRLSRAAAAIVLAAGALQAQQETTSDTFLISSSTFEFPQLTLNRFDDQGGTRQLTAVTLTLSVTGMGTLQISNSSDVTIPETDWFVEGFTFFLFSAPAIPFDDGGGEGELLLNSTPAPAPQTISYPFGGIDYVVAVELPPTPPGGGLGGGPGGPGGPFPPPTGPCPFSGPFDSPDPVLADAFPIPGYPGAFSVFQTPTLDEFPVFVGTEPLIGDIFPFGEILLSDFSGVSGFPITVSPCTVEYNGTFTVDYDFRTFDGDAIAQFASPGNVLDAFDLGGFLDELAAGNPAAEFTGDSMLDQGDFDAYFMQSLFTIPTPPDTGGGPGEEEDEEGEGPVFP
ncbi:MAG: hypothetical protein AAGI30_03475 [Planctomycetota bacterium]